MYTQFYGLAEYPFALTANTRYLYQSEEHSGALTMLKYGILQRAGIVLMTGTPGAGKTMLLRHLVSRELPPATEVIQALDPFVLGDDLISYLTDELDLPVPEQASRSARLRVLEQHLMQRRRERKHVLFVIDEAQVLTDRQLEEVRMLNNLQYEQDMLLQVLLSGQPELSQRIKGPAMRPLAQRITVASNIGPMSAKDTTQYIEHRLKVAGRKSEGLFSPEACALIHKTTGGIPREINIVCETAMTYGFAEEAETIDLAVLKEVITDRKSSGLCLGEPAAAEHGREEEIQALKNRISEMERTMERMKRYLAKQLKAGN